MTRAWLAAVVAVGCNAAAPDRGGDGGPPDAGNSTVDAPAPTLAPVGGGELCKLLSGSNTSDPTANDVQHRANLLGADLGIPVTFGSDLYLLLGHSIGYAGIWKPDESHPDAVGHAGDPASAIATMPDLLCSDLAIATCRPPTASARPSTRR